jgi:mannose-6-phosphate isomerase-like protein (cupin superfamily)
VTIPSGIEHHVVNSGTDVLDHILVSADCASSKCRIDHQPGPDDCVPPDQARQLTRLSCRRIVIGRNDSTPIAAFETAECIYAISSGHAIAHVRLSGTEYEWQYSLDSANCIWIPAGVPHFFRNIGDCPLQIVGFHSGLEA